MEKKEILQFQEDDASNVGMNGKQVFFTKRINGKTIRNKVNDDEEKNTLKKEENKEIDEDLFVEFKNLRYKQEEEKTTTNNKSKAKHQNNKNQKKPKRKLSKKERKIRKRKKVLRFAMLIALIVAVVIFALVSPLFNIKTIIVEGNDKISSSTIESLSGITIGENIFKIRKKNIRKAIKENQYIDSVSIKRVLPNEILIGVSEREVAYQVKVVDSYVYLDYQGYILEVASSGGKVPTIKGLSTQQNALLNGKRLSNKDIESYINTLAKIRDTARSTEILNLITTIEIKDDEYILTLKKEDKIVYLGKANDLTNMMAYVKFIVEAEKGNKGEIFVNGDLNAGFKPFFRETIEETKQETEETKENKTN